MYLIKEYKKLNQDVYLLKVIAKRVSDKCMPGQFVIVRVDEDGERIPLTISDYDRQENTVTLVVQEIGASTHLLGKKRAGDYIQDIVGPLGNPSKLTTEDFSKSKIVFIAGGLGTAPVYPQVKWLFEHGIKADVIIGAKRKDLVIYEDEMKKVASEVFVCTDDGSYGYKGNVCDTLKALIEKGKKYDYCVSIGPMIMMKFVCALTKELGIKTEVSLNPIMVDGTGMCGACRVVVGGEVKFACVDGPEFDGHLVDFDGAMIRQRLYKTEEGKKYLEIKEGDTHHGGCGNC